MNTKLFLITVAFLFSTGLHAQQFIDKAAIEFEVKTNIKKTMGDNSFAEMIKENLPQFKTAYYRYTFSRSKSIYKFDHWDEKVRIPEFLRRNDEENSWYINHSTGRMNTQKNVFGTNFTVEDSIPAIEWKLTNENKLIAGFNCRKAVGKIFDSVYVFAFYTDEITISGGPCSISGLPGMIMGLTIPRMYTSWMATKVIVNNIDENLIKPFSSKKTYTQTELKNTVTERTKEWIRGDDETEAKKWQSQLLWSTLL